MQYVWISNDTNHKQFIDSLQRDYNLRHDIYENEFLNNNSLKNPIRIHFIRTKDFYMIDKNHKLFDLQRYFIAQDLSKFIGVKYRSNKSFLIPRHCNKYQTGSNEICTHKCKPRSCMGYTLSSDMYAECKYLDENNQIQIIPEGQNPKDVDLMVVLTATKDCNSDRESYTAICAQGLLGRPIYGGINFCYNNLVKIYRGNLQNVRTRFIHDILQIMAFENQLFTSFVKPNGSPYLDRTDPKWRNKTAEDLGIIKTIGRSRESLLIKYEKIVSVFRLEKSLNFVRKHFNCMDLEGIDMVLKDDYQWTFDNLKYGEDIMSTLLTPHINEITMLTLVFLEDTGWYYVDHNKVSQFHNGRGLGCTFAKYGCYSFMKDKTGDNLRPYCDVPVSSRGRVYICSGNKKYYLKCGLRKTLKRDYKYIYFRKLKGIESNQVQYYNGFESETEFCPIYKPISNLIKGASGLKTSECNPVRQEDETVDINLVADYQGDDSRCLEYNVVPEIKDRNYGAACFQISNENQTNFNFKFDKITYNCSIDQIVEIEKNGYKYQIECGYRESTNRRMSSISSYIINYADSFLIIITIAMHLNFRKFLVSFT